MSFKHVHEVLDSNLKSNLKITAAVIAEMADLETGEAWPSYATIARRSSVKRRQAISNIEKLTEMGVLTAVGKRRCPSGFTVVWRLNLDALKPAEIALDDTGAADNTGAVHYTPGVQSTTPQGCSPAHKGVQSTTPEPSRTIIEPSKNRQGPPTRKPTKRCPSDWQPRQQDIDALLSEFPTLTLEDIRRSGRKMIDYEFKTAKKDWDAVFRNWVRGDAERQVKAAPKTFAKQKLENTADAFERFMARG